MNRKLRTLLTTPALLTTAAAVVPLTGAPVTSAAAASHPTSTSHTAATTKPTATTHSHTFTGPSVDMRWGPVQVTVTITNKKITSVQASAPMERARSNFINSQAIPWLRQETLKAQSANIDLIGGATMTSEAYTQSLQAALNAAHKAHSL